MASQSVKNQPNLRSGFTLLESLVVVFIFTTAIVLVSQIYFNLIKSTVQVQNLQLALDNVRFGAEKLWNEVKTGSEFIVDGGSLVFKNRRCQRVEVYKQGGNIFFNISNQPSPAPLFDNNLIFLQDFKIYKDTTSTGAYFKSSNKIFIFEYKFILKTKTADIPLAFHQTVAPLNSVLINKPCL